MTLEKDTRSFTTEDENLIHAYMQNGWNPKKEETPLPEVKAPRKTKTTSK